ncbi:hypothetical protein [Flavobacterium commune]|uniref:Lipocalin-like domain-containing protein n=1 Tax=Flavobacterium commune TaxID=1306519 RepID=A0A1D9P9W2_9FLAO|nr:hypothetical protein [Flavobacterium commune]AOZ99359.1 hypothetical protein BIW12_07830 [Flavobacterium commune]
MKTINLLIMVIVLALSSCTKKSTLEDIFITPKNQYWQYSSTKQYDLSCGSINFQFHKDGYSHRYKFSTKEGYTLLEGMAGDVIIRPQKWSVKNDSTFVWGHITYKIEHIDRTVIVLSFPRPDSTKQLHWVRLLKVLGEK